jgi:hypothetical protein
LHQLAVDEIPLSISLLEFTAFMVPLFTTIEIIANNKLDFALRVLLAAIDSRNKFETKPFRARGPLSGSVTVKI